ncbi:MAG: hypothetical protein ACJAUD_000831 [Crocinitomicaceae bacterium]|jgi:hypothetical protein
MKMEIAVGVILATGLTTAMIGCEKKEVGTNEVIEDSPNGLTLAADSIRRDSTIENREIIAFAGNILFDEKYLAGATDFKPTKQFLLDQISIKRFNENTLVQIDYEDWGNAKHHSAGVYLLDSNLRILSQGIVPGSRYGLPEITIEDWNKDKTQELKVNLDLPVASVNVHSKVERIYSFIESDGLKLIFELEKEYRNCSAVMEGKSNYTSRSYSFTSKNNIEVKQADYLIDCEQFDRIGSIAKLKKVSSKEYNVQLP